MTHSEVDDRDELATATYRCVCGESLALEEGAADCQACGRHYDQSFLRSAGADTVSIDSEYSPARLVTQPENDPYIGERLGHFKILARIGDGGMGAVYHALDESLQRYVALKVIHNAADGSEKADLDRLFQEARAQARVNHPHVVHVYYVGIESNTPFLAMELVGSGTLADRMREGPIPFHQIVRYAVQVTRALDCAAEYDIVHGDIKPSNVLLVDAKTVKLSDFGLARRRSAPSESKSKFSGTPDYMPPESTRGGGVNHQGDMYSLGITLFEMTFGRLPYSPQEGCDLSDRLKQHREAPVEFPERWPADLPEGWQRVLQRLLSKDPSGRYASFTRLESDLKRLAPINLPVANPLLRGLAWMVDGMLVAAGLILIQVLSTFLNVVVIRDVELSVAGIPELGVLGSLVNFALSGGFLFGVGLLQAHWGNTTGKRFLQILIVDQHGLKPRRRVLALRTVFQFSWAWWVVVSGFLAIVGMMGFAMMLGGCMMLFLLIEMVSVLLMPGGQSVHDRILGTRVVLDASPESGKRS